MPKQAKSKTATADDKPKKKIVKKIVVKAEAPGATLHIPVLKLARDTTTEVDFTGKGKLKIDKVEHAGGAMRVICKQDSVTSTFAFH